MLGTELEEGNDDVDESEEKTGEVEIGGIVEAEMEEEEEAKNGISRLFVVSENVDSSV